MTDDGIKPRDQAEARRVLNEHYPFKCCAVCGLQITTCLTVAHLDHDRSNNAPDNLAWLCQTHHWMYDANLYPVEAIRLLQAHWQVVRGVPTGAGRGAPVSKLPVAASCSPAHWSSPASSAVA